MSDLFVREIQAKVRVQRKASVLGLRKKQTRIKEDLPEMTAFIQGLEHGDGLDKEVEKGTIKVQLSK